MFDFVFSEVKEISRQEFAKNKYKKVLATTARFLYKKVLYDFYRIFHCIMKLPRDISGAQLAAALKLLGYELTRQSGSHMRLVTTKRGEHRVTIPKHDAIRIGTLGAILADVAQHFELSREEVTERLFGKGKPRL